jgi:hypothetical protein
MHDHVDHIPGYALHMEGTNMEIVSVAVREETGELCPPLTIQEFSDQEPEGNTTIHQHKIRSLVIKLGKPCRIRHSTNLQ